MRPQMETGIHTSIGLSYMATLEKHQNETQLQHLANIPSIPVNQLYKHMINGIKPITPFMSPEKST